MCLFQTTQNAAYLHILALCPISALSKTALISLVTHICTTNPSISLTGPGENRETVPCQDDLRIMPYEDPAVQIIIIIP